MLCGCAQALRGDPEANVVPIVLSAAVMLAAVAIEATADLQLDRFIAAAGSKGLTKGICSQGLWGKLAPQCQQCSCTKPSRWTIIVHSVAPDLAF